MAPTTPGAASVMTTPASTTAPAMRTAPTRPRRSISVVPEKRETAIAVAHMP